MYESSALYIVGPGVHQKAMISVWLPSSGFPLPLYLPLLVFLPVYMEGFFCICFFEKVDVGQA